MPSSAGITALVSWTGVDTRMLLPTLCGYDVMRPGEEERRMELSGQICACVWSICVWRHARIAFFEAFLLANKRGNRAGGGEEEPLASKLASCHPPPQPRPPTIKYITTNNIRILFTLKVSFVDSRRDLIPWSYYHSKSSIMNILG